MTAAWRSWPRLAVEYTLFVHVHLLHNATMCTIHRQSSPSSMHYDHWHAAIEFNLLDNPTAERMICFSKDTFSDMHQCMCDGCVHAVYPCTSGTKCACTSHYDNVLAPGRARSSCCEILFSHFSQASLHECVCVCVDYCS